MLYIDGSFRNYNDHDFYLTMNFVRQLHNEFLKGYIKTIKMRANTAFPLKTCSFGYPNFI